MLIKFLSNEEDKWRVRVGLKDFLEIEIFKKKVKWGWRIEYLKICSGKLDFRSEMEY